MDVVHENDGHLGHDAVVVPVAVAAVVGAGDDEDADGSGGEVR